MRGEGAARLNKFHRQHGVEQFDAASRRAPLLTRAVLLLLLPLLIGGWFVQHAAKRSLPANMITLVRGVSAPVTVVRDAHGVPRIEAQTDAVAFFAISYVHAQDRLWQLEVQRHIAQGRLSELFGGESVPRDIWFRTLGLYESAKLAWPSLSKEAQALSAYAAGINASIADQRICRRNSRYWAKRRHPGRQSIRWPG